MRSARLVGLSLACLAVGPALAQGASDPTSGGIKMGDHADVSLHIMDVDRHDLLASKLVGMTVYNNQQVKLGEIKDLVFKDGFTIVGVVVSIGGVLGIGEKYILVDPASLVVSEKDGNLKAYVDASRDSMEAQTKFSYDKKP